MAENEDFAGYEDLNGLRTGYRESGAEAKRQRERAEAEAQRAQLLEQQLQATLQQQRPRNQDPGTRLSELGVPVDALDEYVGQQIQRAFAPIAQGLTARQRVLSRYPDYPKHEAEVAQFIESDPNLSGRYQRLMQTDPETAIEFAMLKYGESRRDSEPEPKRKPQKQAASEAQIPSARTGDARTQPSVDQEQTGRAWDHYQKTGNPVAFAKARLRQIISDDFYNK